MTEETCPSDPELLAVLEGGTTTPALQAHLAGCESCRRRAGSLRAGGETADDALRTGAYEPAEAAPPAVAVHGYEVLGELGRGGMGVVYKARQVGLNRLVALKMVRAGAHAGAGELARFRSEAEAVARLQHPNIVQVHEVGEADGHPFFSLELVPGGSLADRLRGAPLAARQAAELVELLARAVHAAHRAGVVHRDLKPANVLLTADGVPKITDFGLAKRLDGDSGQTQSGAVLGTPSYMAPEQAAGKAREVGPAADVYALGAVLYECLTGRPPFKGAGLLDTLEQVRRREPVAPRLLQPSVPRDLETLCLKCLHKEPGRRYADAEALADDLRRFREGRPVAARPVALRERAWRWCRRNPVVAGLAALAALSLLGGLAASLHYAARAEARAADAVASEGRARQAQRAALRQAYLADLNFVPLAWKDADVRRLREVLDRQRPADDGPDLRGFEWYYWQQVCRAELFTLAGHDDTVYAATFSPDGRRLATASADRSVKVWDADTGRELWAARGPAAVRSVTFSPDARRLAAGALGGAVTVWDAETGREQLSFRAGAIRVTFSPDGRRLAGGVQNAVKVWDAADGRELLALSGHTGVVAGVAFRPDGEVLASGSFDATARLWDLEAGREAATLRGARGAVYAVAFDPDGRRLAGACHDHTVRVWDADTGREALTLFGHRGEVVGVAFRPDGARLASASHDRTVRVWDAADGGELLALRGHTEKLTGVAFRPDGARLASASYDGTVKVWDAAADPEARTCSGHADRVVALAFAPDGRRLASASWDKTLRVWDGATGREASRIRGPAGVFFTAAAFHPGGRRLAAARGWGHSHGEPLAGEVRVYDAGAGTEILAFGGGVPVHGLAYSPDGAVLAGAGHDHTVKLWDAATGRLLHSLSSHGGPVRCVAFARDGRLLASGSDDRTVRLWDAASGRPVGEPRPHADRVAGVAFHPHGTRLASACWDATVTVWDTDTPRQLLRCRGHLDRVTAVAFSPDGSRLASASHDRSVRVWDAAGGEEVLTLAGHADAVAAVAFRPDGRCLASASWDRTLRLWGATPAE